MGIYSTLKFIAYCFIVSMFSLAKNNPGFRPQKDCTYSKRQGDFSTLCYVEQRGIYITVMNICDVPYSVNVVSILSGGVNDTTVENQTYTAEMDTSVIHLTGGYTYVFIDNQDAIRYKCPKPQICLKFFLFRTGVEL